MKLIFGNSAWVATRERFILKLGTWRKRALRVRFGMILHPTLGPILIDTGYTKETTVGVQRSTALKLYNKILNPKLVEHQQAEVLLATYGYTPDDVKKVIVTHFHADHVSGLRQFKNAQFISLKGSWDQVRQSSKFQNLRHGCFPELVPDDFEERLIALEDLRAVKLNFGISGYDIFGDGLVIACPLPGHADGHFGVLIHLSETRVFYAVDVQWLLQALEPKHKGSLATRLISHCPSAAIESTKIVREFRDKGLGEVILCHDPSPCAFDFSEQEAVAQCR